jgi:hypothetical protein
MNYLFSPDKSNFVLKKYHTSSKLLIPLFFGSYILNKSNFKTLENLAYITCLTNFGFHSYVSTSCIITDYIKPKLTSNFIRASNVGLHSLALIGYYKIVYKNIYA